MEKFDTRLWADDTAQTRPNYWVQVALDVPLPVFFDYCYSVPLPVGVRVIVPFRRRQLVGIVMGNPSTPTINPAQVKSIVRVLEDLPPFSEDWLRLARFAAHYYQRPVGEVLLMALPPSLRQASAYTGKRAGEGPVARLLSRRLATVAASKQGEASAGAVLRAEDVADEMATATRLAAVQAAESVTDKVGGPLIAEKALTDGVRTITRPVTLNVEQRAAVTAINALTHFKPVLVYGVTGSGKTEVYLQAALQRLMNHQQVLWMVPEINLTPQLEGVLRARLDAVIGPEALVVLHSGRSNRARLAAWVQAQQGEARLVLGTRMAIFTPLPKLGLIVVDEEHDVSYKQQDGLYYSARDLAVWRARDRDVPVLLGSATPSLESWRHAQQGHYLQVTLAQRAKATSFPRVQLVDTSRLTLNQGLSPQLITAIQARLAGGEQVLVFLNRRGYAPVLHCLSCFWVSHCVRCSVFMVLHRTGGAQTAHAHRLQCHHCGYQAPVPAACPECGDQDLQPMGRGTQRVEAHLAELFPNARILRIDADSTRRQGSGEALFAQVHAGEVDILVGTQMVAKGHDFTRLGLVGVLNADTMLFTHDFRASERLFAQLMQVAGRAGRHAAGAEVLVQTRYPHQPLYQALCQHDYSRFAQHTLRERASAGLPPFAYQALLTAQAPDLAHSLAFLQAARALPDGPHRLHFSTASAVTRYDPVPLRVIRVANMARAQLLVESESRPALQAFLTAWSALLPELSRRPRVRWQLEIDPLGI